MNHFLPLVYVPKGPRTKEEGNSEGVYLSIMVGVDALIASWCRIFRPESHLAASSFESAVDGIGERACELLGDFFFLLEAGIWDLVNCSSTTELYPSLLFSFLMDPPLGWPEIPSPDM